MSRLLKFLSFLFGVLRVFFIYCKNLSKEKNKPSKCYLHAISDLLSSLMKVLDEIHFRIKKKKKIKKNINNMIKPINPSIYSKSNKKIDINE